MSLNIRGFPRKIDREQIDLLSSLDYYRLFSEQGETMNRILCFIASCILWASFVHADTIAVIGTGDVGGALGPEFAALGHTVIYGSRNPQGDKVMALLEKTGHGARAELPAAAAAQAEIVVLAVPGLLVEEIVAGLGDLSGKIIVDPTNPLVRREDGKLGIEQCDSNAEIIQTAAPEAVVVKAFNTLGWRSMVDPDASGGPISIPLVGNDPEAKQKIAGLASAMGLQPIDVGPLQNARHVEGLSVLLLNNIFGDGPSFEFHLRPSASQ